MGFHETREELGFDPVTMDTCPFHPEVAFHIEGGFCGECGYPRHLAVKCWCGNSWDLRSR